MKAKAKAPANIAFIKYWGKKDQKLRIPMNSSISMNLSAVFTITSVEFDRRLKMDKVYLNGKKALGKERERVVDHLDRVREMAGMKLFADMRSVNNFPKGSGIASSASGFAALTLAAVRAANLKLSTRQLSILARMGSGSACRSIPDGFVEWKTAKTSNASFARSLFPPDYWDICDLIVIVTRKKKKVSSTKGHAVAESSPFYKTRIRGMKEKVEAIKKALRNKDFNSLGQIIEEDAINMHAVMMTSSPPLYYWTGATMEIIQSVIRWREEGFQSYFTIDAGPNVHIICRGRDVDHLKHLLLKIHGVRDIIINRPAKGARLISSRK